LSQQRNEIDAATGSYQTAAMKYLPHLLLSIATASLLCSCAATGGAGGGGVAEEQLGPHSAQKFTLVHRIGGRSLDPNVVEVMCLVLTVDQKMNGNEQEITAKAAAHKDGPHGAVMSANGVQVMISSPGKPISSEPHKEVGTVSAVKTVPAPGGKYQTVSAQATMQNPEYANAQVELTIPGGQ
jgi:hypothetical protein